jgi:predicted  nucleic acid-binding Zn-ribbon protein
MEPANVSPISPMIFALISILSLILNGGLAWLVWVRKPGEDAARAVQNSSDRVADLLRAHHADVEQRLREQNAGVEQQLQAQASRIAKLETTIEHMPTSDEVRKLEGTVQRIDERTDGLNEAMRGARSSLGRIESWLMEIKLRAPQ